jgi:hypothetical protein
VFDPSLTYDSATHGRTKRTCGNLRKLYINASPVETSTVHHWGSESWPESRLERDRTDGKSIRATYNKRTYGLFMASMQLIGCICDGQNVSVMEDQSMTGGGRAGL